MKSTFEQIKSEYPNEWVLLRVFDEKDSLKNNGEVLLHGKDYLELCYKSSEVSKEYLTKILFTGTQTTNRKWLKATRLKDNQQTT